MNRTRIEKQRQRYLESHVADMQNRAMSVEVHNPSGHEYGWQADCFDARGYCIGGTSGVPLDVAQISAYRYAAAITMPLQECLR